MSSPKIRPFMGEPDGSNLGQSWARPDGEYPDRLWPSSALQDMAPTPTDWVTIREHWHADSDAADRATSCLLLQALDVQSAFKRHDWIGDELGEVGRWGDGPLETGLQALDRLGRTVEFFCQVRHHHDLHRPSVEFSHPFVWYWDAVPRSSGLAYVDSAGRDRELARWTIKGSYFRVQVRALELRQYLAQRDLVLLVQFDHRVIDHSCVTDSFPDVESEYSGAWASGSWYGTSTGRMMAVGACSRLLGKYIINPASGGAKPRWESHEEDIEYPEFQYGVDHATGEPMRFTCDPEVLGDYFDGDEQKLHYLTPVYFSPDVLGRYTAEPTRYEVSSTNIRCLDIWLLQISKNTAGLVEVYLGDLGRDLPADEWSHWLAHNVAPSGRMAEDRFRRDFMNQFASPDDPTLSLRKARKNVAEVSSALVGAPVWRDLTEPLGGQFERLHSPTNSDPSALYVPLLTVTKALFDSIDPKPLRNFLHEETGEARSLELLERVEMKAGGDGQETKTLRLIQQLRSRGGIAHLPNSGTEKALQRLGIDGLPPADAFYEICRLATAALVRLAELFTKHLDSDRPPAPDDVDRPD